ncbi:hypothetical protein [Rummeliibacillus pycnus]|uniref:hypothetical protein n=1 Tax=Rummeliibacillus pycnus TaxID=101070 RepID=UPI003D2955A4
MGKIRYFFVVFLIVLLGIAGCSNVPNEPPNEPPNISVKIKNQTIEVSKGGYRWETKGLFSNSSVIADTASPMQIAESLIAQPVEKNSIAICKFSDSSKPTISANLWEEENQTKTLQVKDSKITLPSEKGRHIIEIYAEWKNGNASYTFVVDVK